MKFESMNNVKIQTELGRRLKRKRLEMNLSQDQVSERSGISRRTVTNTENGKGCSLLTLIALCRSLNLLFKLDTLFPDDDNDPFQSSAHKARIRRRASGERSAKENDSDIWEWE